MEIGTEISRKIRGAIKGKLQELGAYVDEELPDYIMVMMANKKSQEQMTEDLSLFLGNNTVRFTVWLHGVLDKLRSVTTEPTSLKSSDSNIFESSLPSSKSSSRGSDERRREEILPPLAVSSTRAERNDFRVSTSTLEQRAAAARQSCEDGAASHLMSTVKPLKELSPSEAVIDIKPEPDDLIDEDLNFVQENPLLSRKKAVVTVTYGPPRPTAEIYRPPAIRSMDSQIYLQRLPQQGSLQSGRQLDMESCRALETIQICDPEAFSSLAESYRPASKLSADKINSELQEESSRKRKLPVISSVVKVKKFSDDGEEEEEEEDYGLRIGSISSSVSVPAKPERRPSLPPSKQANKNLILKAISEAQESVTKTTNYSTVPQKQTVPVAPRTRTSQDEPLLEVIHVQSRPSRVGSQIEAEEPKEQTLEIIQVEMEELTVLQKQEKVLERCKYWPACKNGDECAYHHPTLPCKVFPSCKFADKCLFIHPNCKYDAKCTKPDCPYTHASRRIPVPPPKPAPLQAPPATSNSQLCRFFPACKKMECPFYHPKHCRFNTQCTRPDCPFYHPTIAVPPRHALKWTRTQTSE
ncbi:zinc finger CCCH domain-containing protein 14 isoform X3 [Pelodiscus sinensis]|uniref:zinc finger CCCH domain-containing protein 14 isoform X3 n=1 Tax=Pelodiscus sinensis TaxID=13735 RepID=UPI003F6AAF3B